MQSKLIHHALLAMACCTSLVADDVDNLVAKLGDPSYTVRIAATNKLIELNPDPVRISEIAEASDDPEVRHRLREVMNTPGDGWQKLDPKKLAELNSNGSERGSIYLAKTTVDGFTYIGKHLKGRKDSHFPIGEREVRIKDFQIWTGRTKWKKWKPGITNGIPMGAAPGNKLVYAARAKIEGGTTGMWVEGDKAARIPWGNKVLLLENFEILVDDTRD